MAKGTPWDVAVSPLPSDQLEWICIASGKKNDRFWAKWAAYPPNDVIRQRLDEAFGPEGWNFRVVEGRVDIDGEQQIASVHGRLEIGDCFREQYGADEFGKKRGWVDFFKSAASRAFVKCALMFGIGAECRKFGFEYTDDRDKPPSFKPGQKGGGATRPAALSPKSAGKGASSSPSGSSGVGARAATDKQKTALKGLMGQLREAMGKEAADERLKQCARDKGLNLKTLSVKEAGDVIAAVQEHLKDV